MEVALMRTLGRPLPLEGEAGVGKTEVTRVALTPKVGVGLSLLRSPPWHNASG
jgi:hypothetical protein